MRSHAAQMTETRIAFPSPSAPYALLTPSLDKSSLDPFASYRRPLELRSFVVQLTADDLMLGLEVSLVEWFS